MHPHEHRATDPDTRRFDRRGTDPDVGPVADRDTQRFRATVTFTVDAAPATHADLAERIQRAGARAWAAHHGQPDPSAGDDVPVADDGEHGDIDALRAAHDAACARGDRPAIRYLSRRIAVHPAVHRPG